MKTEYQLSGPQAKILASKKRFKIVCAGRRFGKSWLSGAAMLYQAVNYPKSKVWYVAPTYENAMTNMWDGWFEDNLPEAYISEKNKQRKLIRLKNGSRIIFRSADDPGLLRGSGIDLLVLDECCKMRNDTFETIRPMLSDKHVEGKALYISTPMGRNWFYDLYQLGLENPDEYDCFQYTTIEGGNVLDSEIESARRDMSPKMFAQEYLASFETLSNLVYENYSRSQNTCPLNDMWGRRGEIHVGIDFNVNPMTAAIAVENGKDIIFFDEIVEPNSSTQHLCNLIKRKYPGVAVNAYPDPTGNKRQTSAVVGVTDFSILKANKFKVHAPRAPYPSRDKFNAFNTALLNAKGERHLFIAEGRCPKLRAALDGYCYKADGESTDKSQGYDHITDAAAYLVAFKKPIKRTTGLNRPRVFGY